MPLALWPTVKLDHSKRNPGGPRWRWWRRRWGMMTHCVQKHCGLAENALADRPPGNLHTILGEAVTGDIIICSASWSVGRPSSSEGSLPWPQGWLRGGVSHSSPLYWVHIRLDYFLTSPSQLSIVFIQHRLACPRLESLNSDGSFLTRDRLVL